MVADAKITIPTENHNPRLNPKIIPPTINPMEINPPIIMIFLKKEKSLLEVNATAEIPANIATVNVAAWKITFAPPSILVAINSRGKKIIASNKI